MSFSTRWLLHRSTVIASLALTVAACSSDSTSPAATKAVVETRLVADLASLNALTTDTLLLNPWGLAFGASGTLWVGNNHSSTSTLYTPAGVKLNLNVIIPSPDSGSGGAPTGVILNSTGDFLINGVNPAIFIFAGEDGVISAWNTASDTAQKVADRSAESAVYKDIAMASDGGANKLYLTNFKNDEVDVFDASFNFLSSFTDNTLPAGYAPFGIHTIDGKLYVTFALQKGPDNEDDQSGAGHGYIDVFNPDGTMVKRLVSQGQLNSPWAVVMAPDGWGSFGGDLLVGNFGDGHVNVYNPGTGKFVGTLHDAANNPIVIDGLWDLTFGLGDNANALYFSSGPSDEDHGLVGTLTVVP